MLRTPAMRAPKLARLVFAGALVLSLNIVAATTTPAQSTQTAEPDMSDQDIAAVKDVLSKMSEGFLAGDVDQCMALFGGSKESRDRISKALRNEFRNSRYLKFEVVDVLPDYKLQDRTYSVDAQIKFQYVDRERPLEMQQAIENTISQSFMVRKKKDGSFLVLSSPFFDTLGLRSGMGYVVSGLLGALGVFILLAFWVWMSVEAWRARPRQRFWRWFVVLVPVVGGCAFFISAYLPGKLRPSPSA